MHEDRYKHIHLSTSFSVHPHIFMVISERFFIVTLVANHCHSCRWSSNLGRWEKHVPLQSFHWNSSRIMGELGLHMITFNGQPSIIWSNHLLPDCSFYMGLAEYAQLTHQRARKIKQIIRQSTA